MWRGRESLGQLPFALSMLVAVAREVAAPAASMETAAAMAAVAVAVRGIARAWLPLQHAT